MNDFEQVGLLAAFLRGRKWYGSEWYITVAGGIILFVVIVGTILAPLFSPYDPTKPAGGAFVPPGGGKVLLVTRPDSTIRSPEELKGKKVSALARSTAAFRGKKLKAKVYYYPSVEKALKALVSGRVAAALVDVKDKKELAQFDGKIKVVGKPFGKTYLMGTDNLGRDIWSRIVWGARGILLVAILSALFSMAVGVPLGLVSGYTGGILDRTLSLIMDSVYSFPGLILAIAMAAMLGPGILNIAIAISVVYIPTYFRITRGQVLSVKEELYVEAAKSLGAVGWMILKDYIFPNVVPSIVVVFSLNIADSILTEAGLSFLGLGLPPPTPDWGFDLNKGRAYLPRGYWWPITFPGMMIAIVALGFSLLGEGLGEIMNPRLREL